MSEHTPVEQIADASSPDANRKPWTTPQVMTSQWREINKSTSPNEYTNGFFHAGPS
jgi:hypothetical protein